ncbi:phage terminase small subunit [Shewanella algae]|uniref:phage terminase small subunit n=1 Tax=Shewanella algae TaxID=38313 RepID=UPI003005797D
MDADLQALKRLERRADKVAMKRDKLLPKWLPVVDDYLSKITNGETQPYDHPVFAHCTVWLFDVGDYDSALRFAFRAIELGQPTPERIKRTWPTFVAGTVLDWAQIQAENGHSLEPYFSQVFAKVKSEWRLPEPVTALYYKHAGLALIRGTDGTVKPSTVGDAAQLEQADQLLEQAALIYRNAQVKTIRNQIAMRLRALEAYKGQPADA